MIHYVITLGLPRRLHIRYAQYRHAHLQDKLGAGPAGAGGRIFCCTLTFMTLLISAVRERVLKLLHVD